MRTVSFVLAAGAVLLAPLAGADDRHRLQAIGEGRAIYLANCASCHGVDAKGGSAPALTSITNREGHFTTIHVATRITGRRDGLGEGAMPCWSRVLVDRWPRGEAPAMLQTWKLTKYVEFIQAPGPERVASSALREK